MKTITIKDMSLEPITVIGVNDATRQAEADLTKKGIRGKHHESAVTKFSTSDLCINIVPFWCAGHNAHYYAHYFYLSLMGTFGGKIYVPIEEVHRIIELLGGDFEVCESNDKLYAVWTRNIVKWNF